MLFKLYVKRYDIFNNYNLLKRQILLNQNFRVL